MMTEAYSEDLSEILAEKGSFISVVIRFAARNANVIKILVRKTLYGSIKMTVVLMVSLLLKAQ